MQRRNEWLGLGAVILLVIGLLAYQFLPVGDDVEGAERIDASDLSESTNSEATTDDSTNDDSTTGDAASRDTVIVYDWLIQADDLPDEAWDTLFLIEDNGPYPYDKDGSTFQNREGLLPDHPRGYYREFTVETPGSSDRGARRIVSGSDGELYWTDDHYDSFAQIVGW